MFKILLNKIKMNNNKSIKKLNSKKAMNKNNKIKTNKNNKISKLIMIINKIKLNKKIHKNKNLVMM